MPGCAEVLLIFLSSVSFQQCATNAVVVAWDNMPDAGHVTTIVHLQHVHEYWAH